MNRFSRNLLASSILVLSAGAAQAASISFDVKVTGRYTYSILDGYFVPDTEYVGGESFILTVDLDPTPYSTNDTGVQDDGSGGFYRSAGAYFYSSMGWTPLSPELDALNGLVGATTGTESYASASNQFGTNWGENNYLEMRNSTLSWACERHEGIGTNCDVFWHSLLLGDSPSWGYDSVDDVTVPGPEVWYPSLSNELTFTEFAYNYWTECLEPSGECTYGNTDGIMYSGTARYHSNDNEVPLPGTLGLLGIGLAGLGLVRRKNA